MGPLVNLRDCKYTYGMNTDAGPTLCQVLEWLDEGVRLAESDGGSKPKPERIVWRMLEREVAAMKGGGGFDRERAGWVLTWLRYLRYRDASPNGVRKAAVAVAGGARAQHVAQLLDRDEATFTRQRLADFRDRMGQLIVSGLRADYGVELHPDGGSFYFNTGARA